MIGEINWLHISDLHLEAGDAAWSQDVVLKALQDDIGDRIARNITVDFVLVTGDLAFSGAEDEYDRARGFFEDLASIVGVPPPRIFCVPGNHDVNRSIQKTCFAGARHILKNAQQVDIFLGDTPERDILLQRQQAYREFVSSCFGEQELQWTSDGLGYVALIPAQDLVIGVVGLNSSWLAEGGRNDRGQLLIGERQIIEAQALLHEFSPHIVIGMVHHPFTWLREFEQRITRRRLTDACDFFHSGHLHEHDVQAGEVSGSRCVFVAAGAAYETRHTENCYSLVRLKLLPASCEVLTVRYAPTAGRFSSLETNSVAFEIQGVIAFSVGDLASAISGRYPELRPTCHYLSSLIVGVKTEVLLRRDGEAVFGAASIVDEFGDDEFTALTIEFLSVSNIMKLFRDKPLTAALDLCGEPILNYGKALKNVCASHDEVSRKISDRESEAQTYANVGAPQKFEHTFQLYRSLREEGDWALLKQLAERYCESSDSVVASEARRMIALSLAHADSAEDKEQALDLYLELARSPEATFEDHASAIALMLELDRDAEAKEVTLSGLEAFPKQRSVFVELGYRLAEKTGDRDFRKLINPKE